MLKITIKNKSGKSLEFFYTIEELERLHRFVNSKGGTKYD